MGPTHIVENNLLNSKSTDSNVSLIWKKYLIATFRLVFDQIPGYLTSSSWHSYLSYVGIAERLYIWSQSWPADRDWSYQRLATGPLWGPDLGWTGWRLYISVHTVRTVGLHLVGSVGYKRYTQPSTPAQCLEPSSARAGAKFRTCWS